MATPKPGPVHLLDALRKLVAVTVYSDNGYCSICHGDWPNEHRPGCAGKLALAVIQKAKT